MLCDDKTNLVSDPLMNSLSTYGRMGQGAFQRRIFAITPDLLMVRLRGYPNGGSIDARKLLKPFTKYRIYAMVRTEKWHDDFRSE